MGQVCTTVGLPQCGEFRTSYDQAPRLDSGRCNAPAPNLSCGWLNKIIRPIRPIRPIRFRGACYFPLMQNDGKFDFATAKRIFRRVQVHCTCRGPAATLGCPQDKKERRRWAVRGTKRSIAPAVVQRRRWAVRGTKALRRTKNPLPENR